MFVVSRSGSREPVARQPFQFLFNLDDVRHSHVLNDVLHCRMGSFMGHAWRYGLHSNSRRSREVKVSSFAR